MELLNNSQFSLQSVHSPLPISTIVIKTPVFLYSCAVPVRSPSRTTSFARCLSGGGSQLISSLNHPIATNPLSTMLNRQHQSDGLSEALLEVRRSPSESGKPPQSPFSGSSPQPPINAALYRETSTGNGAAMLTLNAEVRIVGFHETDKDQYLHRR